MTTTSPKILAQGTLPQERSTIYAVPSGFTAEVSSMVLVNTNPDGPATETRIYVNKLSGGGARNVVPINLSIEGAVVLDDEIKGLGERDSIEASTTGTIDFTIYGVEEAL